MDAVILVGGQGTRLRPLTARRHKSLLPLGKQRAFDWLLDWVRASEFERVVLALGRHNEDLAAAYPDGDHDGLQVLSVIETEPLQSGGAIRNAVEVAGINERFVVLNGDVFVEFDFARALNAHERVGAELTIALHPEIEVRQFGVATVGDRSLITKFVEKSEDPPSNLVNAGVWIFERKTVDLIPPGAVRVEDTLFPDMVRDGHPVLGYEFDGIWADIGTPQRYLDIARVLIERGLGWLDPTLELGRGAVVEASNAGPGCRLAPRAIVRDSVLWEQVDVGEAALVEASVVADGVRIGDGARVTGAVIGPGAMVAPGAMIAPGTIVGADETVGGNA